MDPFSAVSFSSREQGYRGAGRVATRAWLGPLTSNTPLVEVRPWALRSAWAAHNARVSLEGTFVLNSVDQENAGRTPYGVHMAVSCYAACKRDHEGNFLARQAPVIVEGQDLPMTKAEWLDEGKALGARESILCWEIGMWMVRGEQQFIGTAPRSRKARRIFFANRRANWLSLMREAASVTNLTEATLRKYAQVARNGVRVDGVAFAHHIEVQRCRLPDEKGKPKFHSNSAWEILSLAKERDWRVADTRAEVQRRFPTPKVVETLREKARRFLLDRLKKVDPEKRLAFVDALADELPLVRERVETERTEPILQTLNGSDFYDFEGPQIF